MSLTMLSKSKLITISAVNSGCLRVLNFSTTTDKPPKEESARIKEFRKKLRERTPIQQLEELEEGKHPYQEKEPLPEFENATNPETGEVGGPRGPEPTRYGDWERKGRVSDF